MTWVEVRDVRKLVTEYPLAAAFTISLSLHLVLFGGWRLGKQLDWWNHQATWLLDFHKKHSARPTKADLEKALAAQRREIPLVFVEVDPSLASLEPPKETKYYGAQNARAANPDATVETIVPKVDGQQNKMVRLVDNPRPQPLQPAPPEALKNPAEAEPRPKGGENPGDLAKLKPDELRKLRDGKADIGAGVALTTTPDRPRTLAEARQRAMLAGEKMKQDGGAKRHGKVSLDVKATAFGAYDAAFIAAVQQRWYDLLDSSQFAQRSGKVVLEFCLNYDGRVTDIKVTDNEVGEMLSLLCQRAVLDPAPFPKWPSDMWRMIGKNYRDVTFTFYYN